LIAGGSISSQGQLLQHLSARGHPTTQATLSRDLKILKVGKLPNGRGGYTYAFPDDTDVGGSDASVAAMFLHGYRSIAFSGNLAVIHTLPGHAASVAFALDKLAVDGIVGTVAGDDTILAVLAEGTGAEQARQSFRRRIPGLEGFTL
jgi:transcriptional regulator of arginine metabolism